jgi:energy-coupling factor transporter transmembrane protein EcfT
MRINPTLLLLLLLLFLFSPVLLEWITNSGNQWYRPYIVWLITILAFAWTEWKRGRREH